MDTRFDLDHRKMASDDSEEDSIVTPEFVKSDNENKED